MTEEVKKKLYKLAGYDSVYSGWEHDGNVAIYILVKAMWAINDETNKGNHVLKGYSIIQDATNNYQVYFNGEFVEESLIAIWGTKQEALTKALEYVIENMEE